MKESNNLPPHKLWTKYFMMIGIVSLVLNTCFNMMMATLPVYAKSLGGNNATSGLITGVFIGSALIFRPVMGHLVDTRGRQLILIIGAVIFVIISISYSFASGIGILLVMRFLQGIGFSAYTNACGTMISDIVPIGRLAEGIGFFGMAGALATAIGPALGLSIIAKSSYKVLFITGALLSIVGLIFSFFIDYERKNNRRTAVSKDNKNIKGTTSLKIKKKGGLIEKSSLPSALVILFIALVLGSITTFIPIYAASRGIKNIGIYFTVYASALVFVRFFSGRTADRYGYNVVVLPGLILLVLSFIVLAFAHSLPAFLLSGALYGIGYGAAQPTVYAILIKLCPLDRRGVGNSTFYLTMDLGSGSGAVIWGILSQAFGFTFVYLCCAVCAALAIFSYLFVLQKQLKRQQNRSDV